MTEEEMEELIAGGHEVTGVEFKGAGPRTDKLLQAKVVKAALGMSNHRDGGLVVIGVSEREGAPEAVGLTPQQARTWQHDHIATTFPSYADPSIEFETERMVYSRLLSQF